MMWSLNLLASLVVALAFLTFLVRMSLKRD
jgi:hypothetical protein